MKVNNTVIYMGSEGNGERLKERSETPGKHIIDGSALQPKTDKIAAKKQEAKEKAMKIVGTAYANDKKIDDDLNARRERIRTLTKEKGEANLAIREMEDRRAALREKYAVEADSEEETDLRILEKEVRARMKGSDVILTPDDMEAIEKVKEKGLTEYQQRSLEILQNETPYHDTVYDLGKEIEMENRIITGTKIERLKTHPMLDAQKEAEKVEAAANEEIVGIVMQDAKEHIEEESEKREEEARKEKEKQEEIQQRIDAAKDKKKEMEEFTEEILDGVQAARKDGADIDKAQQEIKDMMNKMKLVEEDIKGAAVDKSV